MKLEDVILAPDILANQPAANSVPVGTIYCITDSSPANKLQRSNGATWDDYAPDDATSSVPTTVQGDVLYASATDTLSALTKDTNATRYLSNTGGSNNPAWAQVALATGVSGTLPVANGGTGITSGLGVIRVVELTQTDTQIKGWPTTGEVQILAAPGSGFYYKYWQGQLVIDAAAGAYTNFDAAAYLVVATTGEAVNWSSYIPNDAGLSVTIVTDIMGSANVNYYDILPPATQVGSLVGLLSPSTGTVPSLDNKAMMLVISNGASGDFTGGNAANSARLRVWYSIEATP